MTPRAGLSTALLVGAVVLLSAIAIGNDMGNRVLGQLAGTVPVVSTTPVPLPTVSDLAVDADGRQLWSRHDVLSVATDPAFPDPRITPEPPPPPPPPPPRAAPAPAASAKPSLSPSSSAGASGTPKAPYTSPPLPIPLISHSPSPDDSSDTSTP